MKNKSTASSRAVRRFASATLAMVSLVAVTTELRAQTFAWNTSFNGNWGDATSWTNAAVPGAADAAVINDGGTATVNGTFSVGSLTVGGTNNGKTSTLLLNSRGPSILNISSGPLRVGVDGGVGVLTVDQDTRLSPTAPRVNVSEINLGDGGTLNLRYLQVSPSRFILTNRITGSGAKVNFLRDISLEANNTYTAPTAITGGSAVFLRNGGRLGGGDYGGNIAIGTGSSYAILSLQNQLPQTFRGTISGAGQLSVFANVTLDPTNASGNTYNAIYVASTQIFYGANTLTIKGPGDVSVVGSGLLEAKSGGRVLSATNNPMGLDIDATSPNLIVFESGSTWNGGGFSNAVTSLALVNSSSATNGIWHKNRPGTVSASGNSTIGGTYILRGSDPSTPFNTFSVEPGATLTMAANMTNDSGDSGFIKAGAGNFVLTGSNSYAGPVVIQAGTLSVGNGGATGNLGAGTISNSGTLLLNRSNNFTVSNGIEGTGSLAKSGAGTVTITGANTYAGATTINAGTLRVGDAGTAGTLGTGEVSISNNAALMIDRSDDITLANVISGAGSVRKVGANTLTLSGQNTYTGGTVISNGTLSVVSAKGLANHASNTVTVAGGATFSLDQNDVFGQHFDPILTPIVINGGTVTNAGAFYNALGPITMNGGTLASAGPGVNGYSISLKGTVTANSNSTISGPGITLGAGGVNSTTFNVGSGVELNVNGGFIDGPGDAWPSDQPSSLVKAGAGSLLLNGTNSYTGDTTISNGAVVVGGSGVLNNGNYDGNIRLAASNSTLVIATSTNQSLGGIISGSGSLVKTNAGTLTITGNENSYTGTTTIGGGTLALNGTHTGGGAYTVLSGATLKGEGRTTSAVTVNTGGNIAPGNSPGELTIGDLTLNGTLNILIDGAQNSLLTVIGNANVTAGTASFTSGATPTEDAYIFLSASGSLTTPFNSTSGLIGDLANYEVIYDADDGIAFLKLKSVSTVVEALFPGGTNAVIGTNTSADFNVFVYNASTNTPVSTFTATGTGPGTVLSAGSASANNIATNSGVELSGLTFTGGTNFGTNNAAFVSVATTNSVATTKTNNYQVVVYDHASNVVTGSSLDFGRVHRNAGLVTSTNSVTVSNKNDSFRIALGVTNNNTTPFITIDTATGLAQGEFAELFGELNTATAALGRVTNTAQLISYDDSDLRGARTNVPGPTIQLVSYVYTGQGVWTNPAGGNWDDFTNWEEEGGAPGLDGALSVNDTAFFGEIGGSSSIAVTNDTTVQMRSITFSNDVNSYLLTGSGSGVFELTASGTNPASITTLAGGHDIETAILLGSDLIISNAAGTGLSLYSAISGVNGILKTGAGNTTLAGANTYQGGTVIEAGSVSVSDYSSSSLGTGPVIMNTANTGTNNTRLLVSAAGQTNTVSNPITVAGFGSGTATIGSSALGNNGWVTFAGPFVLERGVTLVSAPANAVDTLLQNNRTDFSGGISGTGDVTISTATNSRVVFMGPANTFSGNVLIDSNSTLQLSDGSVNTNSLIPDAAVVDVGTNGFLKLAKGGNPETIGGLTGTGTVQAIAGADRLIVDVAESNNFVFNGSITDLGGGNTLAFTKTGIGTQTLGGSNSYSGGTVINAGTLITASSNALGTGNVELLGGQLSLDSGLTIVGNFLWDAGATLSLLDPVSDANNLDILGNLVLTNGPTNFFSLRGTFVGGSPTKLLTAANMTTNAPGLFNTNMFGILGAQPGDYILTISNGALWIDAEYLIVDGEINATGGTNSYKGVRYISELATGVTPTLTIPVGSTINIDPNPVVMSNSSVTTVNGTFSAPGFTVQGGSVLTGAGTMIGNVINEGLLNPGNPTGQMTIQGNFTQTPSGTTGLQVAGPNTYSQLFITGTATLAGTLQVTPINGYALQLGDKYQFLTAQGGISGEYDNIAMPPGQRGRLLLGNNNTTGTLLVAPQSYTQVAVTPNQRRVAKALDAFIPAKSGDRQTVSIALDELRASEYPAAFEAIMPSLYASLPTLAFNQANALNSSMFQRMWMQRINGTGFSSSGMRTAALQGEMGGTDDMQTIVADPERMRKWGAFVDGNGVFATANSAGVLQDYKSQSGGVSAGASYKWNENFATGVYVGYQGLQAQYDNGSRLIDNAVRFGGFGTLGIGGWYLNGLVGGAWHAYDVDREIEFGTVDRTARGNPDAGEFDLALATGYDIKAGNFTLGPVTSMQYTYVGVQGFQENGADSLNLDVNPYNASSLLYSLGAQAAYRWEIGKNFAITPMLSASWQHEFMQNAYPINAAFNTGGPSSSFFFQTSQPQQDYFMAGAGVGFEIGKTWDVSFFWNAVSGGSDLNSQNIYLSIGAEF